MLLDAQVGAGAEGEAYIDGSLFQRELLQLDTLNKKRIQVWINSPGGIVTEGMSIYNAILNSKTKVDTYCVGMAASIAGVIFQAGRTRYMMDYGILMYHDPHGASNSRAIEAYKDAIAVMVSSRTGKGTEDVLKIMARETFLNATEAKAIGFCDVIQSSSEVNKKKMQKVDIGNLYREAGKVLNLLIPKENVKQNTMDAVTLKLVYNKLDLTEGASETSVLTAINKLEEKATKAELALNKATVENKADLDKMKAELDKLADEKKEKDGDYDKLFAKYNALKDEMESDKAKAKKEKDDAEEEDCKNMITDFAKVGRIENKADVIADWCVTAKTIGKDKVKNMIEALPLNKKAPEAASVMKANELKDGETPTSAVLMNAKIKNQGKK